MRPTQVSFFWWGLELTADVIYIPGRAGTWEEPAEPELFEIHRLRCEGKDAHFLLNEQHEYRDEIIEGARDAFFDVLEIEEEDRQLAQLEVA